VRLVADEGRSVVACHAIFVGSYNDRQCRERLGGSGADCVWGETRRRRSLRPPTTVSPAGRSVLPPAAGGRSQVFKRRLLLTFGRLGPKVSRDGRSETIRQSSRRRRLP
jgi:hypothetical protein